jgi:glucose-1-phosphate thymidylyltransferase
LFTPDIVGLMPAGGQAARIAPLPCSKELFPVGFRQADDEKGTRPKVVCHYLLEKMRRAGVKKTYIVLRAGKWDIPTYLGDGSLFDMHFAYLMMNVPFGTPYTADQAYPFIRDAIVAFGFPDIIFQPDDAFVQLLDCQSTTSADIVLGVFPAYSPEIMDMVDVEPDGRVVSIIKKPERTTLRYAWIFAVWTPTFTQYQHEFLHKGPMHECAPHAEPQEELSMGHVLQAAIRDGIQTQAVIFPHHSYLDIGTPDNLVKAVQGTAPQLNLPGV